MDLAIRTLLQKRFALPKTIHKALSKTNVKGGIAKHVRAQAVPWVLRSALPTGYASKEHTQNYYIHHFSHHCNSWRMRFDDGISYNQKNPPRISHCN